MAETFKQCTSRIPQTTYLQGVYLMHNAKGNVIKEVNVKTGQICAKMYDLSTLSLKSEIFR